ncbi:protein MAINTENANCE OF MERISTEMS-like [Gossypium raimondii]|uniref:protein MAINTENANCE OF MERISTEMS-like n=1 Tax=Gossypium raimondii TaxID=29730 RepID=UPI00227B5B76|nr:protein MAINTENANCE OF MERISTEMS-like [Gossypium raimondii]
MPYLELARFGSVALIRSSDLRFDLLSALVERWCSETHIFHFPCGECMVTLEDVALQLELPIDGSPVTGVSSFTDLAALCYQLLGDSLGDGAVLMPDANDDNVHMMYLPLLADLSTARSYSRGSAVLAMLYRELCRATNSDVTDMGECLILLQSWAFIGYHFWHPLVTNRICIHCHSGDKI